MQTLIELNKEGNHRHGNVMSLKLPPMLSVRLSSVRYHSSDSAQVEKEENQDADLKFAFSSMAPQDAFLPDHDWDYHRCFSCRDHGLALAPSGQ